MGFFRIASLKKGADAGFPGFAVIALILILCPPLFAYSGGSGTVADPYQIGNAADWTQLIQDSAHWQRPFILIRDIDFGGATISPVGSSSTPFTGNFNGGGHVLRNAVISRPLTDNVAIFGVVGPAGFIANLGVEDLAVSGHDNVGVVCGVNDGAIANCSAGGIVTGADAVGGLCGANPGEISQCSVSSSVSASGLSIGGLCGANAGTISDSNASGGIAGGSHAGGLCGDNTGTISTSYATGGASGTDYVGGFCGTNSYGIIRKCYAAGAVIGSGASIGGLCGRNYGAVSDSYATGAVNGGAFSSGVGGLCGENPGAVSTSYSAGFVTGAVLVGGLCGGTSGTVTASFWDTQTSGRTLSNGGQGKNTAQMMTLSTFLADGWDFINIWWLPSGGYPALRTVINVTTASLPAGMVGQPYSQDLAASGGAPATYAWSIESGALPAGLTLDSVSGNIAGTPTDYGMAGFTVLVTDAQPATATAALSITIEPAPLTITTAALAAGQVGAQYSQTLSATGGETPYSWSAFSGSLPAGLTLDAATGEISGTPTIYGMSNFTIMVTDAQPLTATDAFAISVAPAPLTIDTLSLTDATLNVAYSQTLSASGGIGPFTWTISAGSLPNGLTLSDSGNVFGTPTEPGIFTFTALVADTQSPATATRDLGLTVVIAPLAITAESLPIARTGAAYSQTLAATGGYPPLAWSIAGGALPDGLTLDSTTGEISGTATTVNDFSFIVEADDSQASPATATTSLSIRVLPPDVTPPDVTGLATMPTQVRTGVDTSIVLTAAADDSATGESNIAAAEYFTGADPGEGNGLPMSAADGAFDSTVEALTANVNATTWTPPEMTIFVRAKDAANNWSVPVSLTVEVVDAIPPSAVTNFAAGPDVVFGVIPGTSGPWDTDSSLEPGIAVKTWTLADAEPIGGISILAGTDHTTYPANWTLFGCNDATGDDKVFLASASGTKPVRNRIKGGSNVTLWQTVPGVFKYVRLEAQMPKSSSWYRISVANISLYFGEASTGALLSWTATANDDSNPASGPAAQYDIRFSPSPITDDASWNAATQVTTGLPAPKAFGESESFVCPLGGLNGTVYFAIKAADAAGNWSPMAITSADIEVPSPLWASAPPDGVTWSPDITIKSVRFYFTKSAAMKSVSIAFCGRPDFPMAPPAGTISKVVKFPITRPSYFAPTPAQWEAAKKVTVETGSMYWRIESSSHDFAAIYSGPARIFFFGADIITPDDMSVPGDHATDGHNSAIWPVADTPPTFSWSADPALITGVTFFSIDVSSSTSFPLRDSKSTVTLKLTRLAAGMAHGYTASAAEWKKIRQIASAADGVLYWRVRGTDDVKALTVVGDAKELYIDPGDWGASPSQWSSLTPSEITWTHAGDGIVNYNLQFSVSDGFTPSAKYTLVVPVKPLTAKSYTLTSADVKKLNSLLSRNTSTTLFYRVRGADADRVFVTYSASKEVSTE